MANQERHDVPGMPGYQVDGDSQVWRVSGGKVQAVPTDANGCVRIVNRNESGGRSVRVVKGSTLLELALGKSKPKSAKKTSGSRRRSSSMAAPEPTAETPTGED